MSGVRWIKQGWSLWRDKRISFLQAVLALGPTLQQLLTIQGFASPNAPPAPDAVRLVLPHDPATAHTSQALGTEVGIIRVP